MADDLADLRLRLPGGKSRDDGLDAVAGCLLSQPVRLSRRFAASDARPDWRPGGGAVVARSDFEL